MGPLEVLVVRGRGVVAPREGVVEKVRDSHCPFVSPPRRVDRDPFFSLDTGTLTSPEAKRVSTYRRVRGRPDTCKYTGEFEFLGVSPALESPAAYGGGLTWILGQGPVSYRRRTC